jgi:hypothetical protein
VAWLDPLDELDELGVLDGDWSWPLLDPLFEELDPLLDGLGLLPEPEVELAPADEWPE